MLVVWNNCTEEVGRTGPALWKDQAMEHKGREPIGPQQPPPYPPPLPTFVLHTENAGGWLAGACALGNARSPRRQGVRARSQSPAP